MRIETRTAKGVTVVEIHGKLTVDHGATEVRDAIRELLRGGAEQHIAKSRRRQLRGQYRSRIPGGVSHNGAESWRSVEVLKPDRKDPSFVGDYQAAERIRLL